MYRFYSQKLMWFALTFANGFVLEKRTQFVGFLEGVFIEKRAHPWKTKPPRSRDGNVPPKFKQTGGGRNRDSSIAPTRTKCGRTWRHTFNSHLGERKATLARQGG